VKQKLKLNLYLRHFGHTAFEWKDFEVRCGERK